LAAAASTSRAAQSAPSVAFGTAWLAPTKAAGDEAGQLQLNGLLMGACLETETAAASTSKTDGLSAFTHSLLRSAERLGASATTADVLTATENSLKALGFRQTPLVLERATPGDLRLRHFITLEPAIVTDSLGFVSDPRFWEGVITAMTPQIHALRAVLTKEGELMSTMYQPTPMGYQSTMGGYQPGFGIGQPSPEDVQKFLPVLGPILATVIPAVVPPIVNSIFAQQKSLLGGGMVSGAYQQSAPEEVQKLLPILGPVLATVIPAILPPIINSLLAQQRSMLAWGGQGAGAGQFGGGQLGGQFNAGPFGGGQFAGLGQVGWGGQQAGQDLTQTVNQSVQEALRRVGIQPPAFAGRF